MIFIFLVGINFGSSRLSIEKYKINRSITAQQDLLIDQNGEALGIVNIRSTLAKADEVGLDLVEISRNAVPPVCKIIDYEKLKYELKKKKAEAKKRKKL